MNGNSKEKWLVTVGLYLSEIERKYNHDVEKMRIIHAYFGLIDSVIDDVIQTKVQNQKVPFTIYHKLFHDLFILTAKKELPNSWNEDQKKKINEGVMVVTELAKELFVPEENYPDYNNFVREVVKVSAEILYNEVYLIRKN